MPLAWRAGKALSLPQQSSESFLPAPQCLSAKLMFQLAAPRQPPRAGDLLWSTLVGLSLVAKGPTQSFPLKWSPAAPNAAQRSEGKWLPGDCFPCSWLCPASFHAIQGAVVLLCRKHLAAASCPGENLGWHLICDTP